jgi:hypothetical protein
MHSTLISAVVRSNFRAPPPPIIIHPIIIASSAIGDNNNNTNNVVRRPSSNHRTLIGYTAAKKTKADPHRLLLF